MGKTRVLHKLNEVAVRDMRWGCREPTMGRPSSMYLELMPESLLQTSAIDCVPESLHARRKLADNTSHESRIPALQAAMSAAGFALPPPLTKAAGALDSPMSQTHGDVPEPVNDNETMCGEV